MKLIIECSLSCHSYEDAIAVITTGKDKFYSNGLDLAEMESMSISEKVDAFSNIQKLLLRWPLLLMGWWSTCCRGQFEMAPVVYSSKFPRIDYCTG